MAKKHRTGLERTLHEALGKKEGRTLRCDKGSEEKYLFEVCATRLTVTETNQQYVDVEVHSDLPHDYIVSFGQRFERLGQDYPGIKNVKIVIADLSLRFKMDRAEIPSALGDYYTNALRLQEMYEDHKRDLDDFK